MFNNLVNRHDFIKLWRGVKHGYLPLIMSRLTKARAGRVRHAWRRQEPGSANWWNIAAVNRRVNRMISGDPKVTYRQYFADKYLKGRRELIALSLGCGRGYNERAWVKLADFARIEGLDISEEAVRQATRAAHDEGFAEIISYSVADLQQADLGSDRYHVVFAKQALHHFSPLEPLLQRVNKCLKPGGFLIVDEFVGPCRFQWTDRQLEIVNAMLAILPEKYRVNSWHDGIKRRHIKPSRLSMILKDPSEAVESDRIIPLLESTFDVIELRDYGLTILNLLFDGIAHNFLGHDSQTQRLIELCCDSEDASLVSGDIRSDFAVALCTKKLPDGSL